MCKGISFIHVSDIHFNKYSGDEYDIDNDLRNEMILDLQNNASKELSNVQGILVCGDIAFSGKKEEYDKAKTFLKEVLDIFELSKTNIYCVPGNHDVDQGIPKESISVYCAQKYIENIDIDSLDKHFRAFRTDPCVSNLLAYPIAEYNNFSAELSSDFKTMQPYWQSSVELNNKYNLVIHGMNSAIISNADDHKDKKSIRKMMIGRSQIPCNKNDVIYMSLCHHPPEFWSDPNNKLEKLMKERVKIQLYGHKHIQKIIADEKGLIISSGAIHPERGADWVPRYNWLTISVDNQDQLNIRIYPRILDESGNKFICDKNECGANNFKLVTLKLGEKEDLLNKEGVESEYQNINETFDDNEIRRTNITVKEIVYKFLNLNLSQQKQVIRTIPDLKEIKPDDYIKDIDYLLSIIKKHKCESKFLSEINKFYI